MAIFMLFFPFSPFRYFLHFLYSLYEYFPSLTFCFVHFITFDFRWISYSPYPYSTSARFLARHFLYQLSPISFLALSTPLFDFYSTLIFCDFSLLTMLTILQIPWMFSELPCPIYQVDKHLKKNTHTRSKKCGCK